MHVYRREPLITATLREIVRTGYYELFTDAPEMAALVGEMRTHLQTAEQLLREVKPDPYCHGTGQGLDLRAIHWVPTTSLCIHCLDAMHKEGIHAAAG